jgi:hypothetical protein
MSTEAESNSQIRQLKKSFQESDEGQHASPPPGWAD